MVSAFAIIQESECIASAAESSQTYDVVVYGGTSAGVSAAVQAKRMGKTAIIVGPDKHLGGLTAGGLGWTDSGRKEAVGGISREFYRRVKKHYDKAGAWIYQKPEEYSRYRYLDKGWRAIFVKFDPAPNAKTDTNNHGAFSTDDIGMNYDYPEGSYERRREILKEHEDYQKGLMWFLAYDPRVPANDK